MTQEQVPTEARWPREKQIEFHLKEFEQLKAEIARLDTAKRSLQVYTVGGVAAVTAWLVTNRDTISTLEAQVVWWLPLFIAFLGAMMSRAYVASAKKIGTYIAKIERSSAHEGLGWERNLRDPKSGNGLGLTSRETIAWAIILAMSLVVGITFGTQRNIPQLIRSIWQ